MFVFCVCGILLIERESLGWEEYALVVEGFTWSTNNAFRVSWSELALMEILFWIILKFIPDPFSVSFSDELEFYI